MQLFELMQRAVNTTIHVSNSFNMILSRPLDHDASVVEWPTQCHSVCAGVRRCVAAHVHDVSASHSRRVCVTYTTYLRHVHDVSASPYLLLIILSFCLASTLVRSNVNDNLRIV